MDFLPLLRERCDRLGVRLVYAAERGSRCYGTHDAGSDWDIYAVVAQPPAAYAGIRPPPATWETEYGENVSTTLFNAPRAALLLARGVIKMREVAGSGCVLFDEEGFGPRMRALSDAAFEIRTTRYQYLRFCVDAIAFMDAPETTGRRWLHLLQPLLSERLVARTGRPAPIPMSDLLAADPEPWLADAAREALDAKRAGRDVRFTDDLRRRLLSEHLEREADVRAANYPPRPEVMDPELSGLADRLSWDMVGIAHP